MSTSLLCNDPPHSCRAGEVDLANSRMRDQGIHHRRRIVTGVLDDIQHARRQACIVEHLSDDVVGFGTQFRRFEDSSVSAHDRRRYRSHGQDKGGIPRCNSQDDAIGFLEDQSQAICTISLGYQSLKLTHLDFQWWAAIPWCKLWQRSPVPPETLHRGAC